VTVAGPRRIRTGLPSLPSLPITQPQGSGAVNVGLLGGSTGFPERSKAARRFRAVLRALLRF
jgi:hypothetical protein